MQKLVIASTNTGKLKELADLLTDLDFSLASQADYSVPEVEETGLSFVENAILKARNAAYHTSLPAIADDSGLAIEALAGAPGIYSARYASPDASDRNNCEKILAELSSVAEAKRSARFHCALVYLRHASDPVPIICQGSWSGRIAYAPRGEHGFGYDPIFYLPELGKTAAELSPVEKNRLSHRAQALARLKQALAR